MLLPPDLQLEEVGQYVLRGKTKRKKEKKGWARAEDIQPRAVLVKYLVDTIPKYTRYNLSQRADLQACRC